MPENASQAERTSLNDVTVVLDDRAILRDVTLEVPPGLVLVRGPNGAGKTTLLRALAGLAPLARGRRVVPSAPPLFVGHRPMLLRGLTARENLTFFAAFRGLAGADVATALRRWGLGDVMDRPVERLSSGQRRRASLARLETELVPLILLDEPFADLDSDALVHLRGAVNSALVGGHSVVMATHMHHELDADATAHYLIDDGRLRPL
ncbi:MAG TPA: heme ABC exporter ATP-binding protein CcmA [Candidatus Limnocylindria bacterium]|nr:heme ABC exporter ATP-binding protein CcmA [Candidatus Limnocylindria bacterium]